MGDFFMTKLRQEFSDLELVILGIVALSMFTSVWIAPAIAFYLILRKVDDRFFKIACYIAIGLAIVVAIAAFFNQYIFELLWEFADSNNISNISNTYGLFNVLQYGLNFIGFALVTVAYLKQKTRNTLISWIFIYISASWGLFFITRMIFLFVGNSLQGIELRLFSIMQFEDYLVGIVIVLLYKSLFFGNLQDDYVEEIYEETI